MKNTAAFEEQPTKENTVVKLFVIELLITLNIQESRLNRALK